MTPADADDDEGELQHPRETSELISHAEAEQIMLDAYRSGRMPHAWLIGGPAGIGKATLAYRMARFVLAHPDPAARDVQKAKSLAVADDHPVAQRIAAQAHPDLLVLERAVNEKTGKLFTVIRVDDVRRTVPFFGSTAGEGSVPCRGQPRYRHSEVPPASARRGSGEGTPSTTIVTVSCPSRA